MINFKIYFSQKTPCLPIKLYSTLSIYLHMQINVLSVIYLCPVWNWPCSSMLNKFDINLRKESYEKTFFLFSSYFLLLNRHPQEPCHYTISKLCHFHQLWFFSLVNLIIKRLDSQVVKYTDISICFNRICHISPRQNVTEVNYIRNYGDQRKYTYTSR